MVKKKMKNIIITVLVVITLCPQFSYAKDVYKAKNLDVPKERITSVSISEDGELLVLFRSKIMIFDDKFTPIKAFDAHWGRSNPIAAIWNNETNRIVYVSEGGDGHEINDEGDVIFFYDGMNLGDYCKTKAEWNGVKYRLENRIPLGNPTGSYSTLIMTDETGEETVLHNAIFSQLLIDLAVWLTIIIIIIAGIKTLIWRLREDKKTEEELAKEAEEEKQREIEAMEIAERESKKAAESITNKYK